MGWLAKMIGFARTAVPTIDRSATVTFLQSSTLDPGSVDRTVTVTFLQSSTLDPGNVNRTATATFLQSSSWAP